MKVSEVLRFLERHEWPTGSKYTERLDAEDIIKEVRAAMEPELYARAIKIAEDREPKRRSP